ncbi:MAG: hypothetical protein ACXVH1_34385 [Solirubrobacteraceae bacterium]
MARRTPSRLGFDREKPQERLATLSGGVAVVNAGAATETKMKEKQHRVASARAALERAPVPVAASRCCRLADAVRLDGFEKQQDNSRAKIAPRALEEPMGRSRNPNIEGSSSSTTCATQEGARASMPSPARSSTSSPRA